MSETPAETIDYEAVALSIIKSQLGRRLTYPYMRAVDAYPISRELHLSGRPVREIHAVTVVQPGKTTLLELGDYEIASGFRLRIAGSVPLPRNVYDPQSRCMTEIHVEYTYGSKPPPAIQSAIDAYAKELELAVTNPSECKLPKRVTSIASQGINMTLLDPQDFLDKGLTGLPAVDSVLRVFNPGRAKARARLFTDRNPPARRLSVVAVPEEETP